MQSDLGRGLQEARLHVINTMLMTAESLSPYVEFISINALQFDCYRALSGLQIINVACPMRGKVRMPIL